jgi:hypothetical protein
MATYDDSKVVNDTVGKSMDIEGGEVSKLDIAFDPGHEVAGLALVEQGQFS